MLLIGAEIQEYRKKAGFSQEEFAEKLGVSRQAVSKWERDRAYPDLDRLVCICEILGVRVDELIYGRDITAHGEDLVEEEKEQTTNLVHMKNLRGKHRLVRLRILFWSIAAACIFCTVMMAVLLGRNEWGRHQDKNENVRVERVYQQYTKADLCYFDDDGRKIMNTVWLDVPGIRDGDYIQCYTGESDDSLYLDYKAPIITAISVLVVLTAVLLLITGAEIRRNKREDKLQIVLEDRTTDEEI